MDFEERLETQERSDSPSLVGSSIRSADDSPHRNYIHPEKYQSSKSNKSGSKLGSKSKSKSKGKHSKLNPAITASLDDLINEGALLGSEEDFEKFLDDDGSVKTDAKYVEQDQDKQLKKDESDDKEDEIKLALESDKPLRKKSVKSNQQKDEDKPQQPKLDLSEFKPAPVGADVGVTHADAKASFYKQEDYSTPNLSEYQLEQEIKDYDDLINHVKSHELDKLPRDSSYLSQNENATFASTGASAPLHSTLTSQMSAAQKQRMEGNLHTPTFYTDRERSRSRSANPRTRAKDRSSSRSSSNAKTSSSRHLARGDSYKNTHSDEPSKYELPPDFEAREHQVKESAKESDNDDGNDNNNNDDDDEEEDDEDDRRTRFARPTMGESIAAAEAKKKAAEEKLNPAFVSETESNPVTRDPSLVTTGDYTNFEVDSPAPRLRENEYLGSTRSASSTNYLRSISRSRSRARPLNNAPDEKNDANTDTLIEEGALVTDDPYASIDQLDTMVKNVLHGGDTTGANFLPLTEETDKELEENTKVAGDTKEASDKEKVVDNKEQDVKKEATQNTKLSGEEFSSYESGSKDQENDSQEGKSVDEAVKNNVHEEEIEKDIKHAKQHSNEKDDANTDTLEKEGALISDDPLEKVEEAELGSKGLVTEPEKSKDAKDKEEEEEKGGEEKEGEEKEAKNKATDISNRSSDISHTDKDDSETKEEGSVADKSAPLLGASPDVDGPEELKEIEQEEENENENENGNENEKSKVKAIKEDTQGLASDSNEKDDANVDKLRKEGALVSDDPLEKKSEEAELAKKDVVTEPEELKHEVKDDLKSDLGKGSDASPDKREEGLVADKSAPLLGASADVDGPQELEELEEEEKEGEKDNEAVKEEVYEGELPADEKAELESAEKNGKAKAETKAETKTKAEAEAEPKAEASTAKEDTEKAGEDKEVKEEDADLDDLDVSPEELRKHLESLPVYIFTSLAGGMQIMHKTNRLATILQANGVKFEYRDLGTDEEAKKIWRRYAQGKTLPGVVRGDDVIGNWQEIDEANEEYKLRELLYETL